MFPKSRILKALWFTILVIGLFAGAGLGAREPAAEKLVTPIERFGHAIGDDYFLVNYTQTIAYWTELDQQSERLSLATIGTTAEGRSMVMAILTSPGNQKNLARYRDIAARLAHAENLSDSEALSLAREGK